MKQQEFLTTKEAAQWLRISPRSLEKHRITGSGPPYHKFGARVLYRMLDLQAWADSRRRRSTSDPGKGAA